MSKFNPYNFIFLDTQFEITQTSKFTNTIHYLKRNKKDLLFIILPKHCSSAHGSAPFHIRMTRQNHSSEIHNHHHYEYLKAE